MRCVAIIPARMASRRLPGKPLMEVGGKALVHWTYDRATGCEEIENVIVATPDREIGRYCQEHGLFWRPTRDDHPTGTHRCAEVIRQMKRNADNVDVVVNWQVDEPLVPAKWVHNLVFRLRTLEATGIATITTKWEERNTPEDENMVKAAVTEGGKALWFSRAPMRGARPHVGVYAFRREVLEELEKLSPTKLGEAESLEQLAWLEHGYEIRTIQIPDLCLSINTQWEWLEFRRMVQRGEIR